MPASLKSVSLLTATLACALYAPAQQPAQQDPIQIQVPPLQKRDPGIITLQANSRAVLLDVIITDNKGNPIHGLKPQDFQVLEDGQPQTISSVEEHHPVTAAEIAARPAPPKLAINTWTNTRPSHLDDNTRTVFLLDSLNTPVPAQMYVRDQLLSYFNTMAPGTEVAVFQLDTQLRMLQGFTSDPEVLRTAIKERDKPQLSVVPQGRQYAYQAVRMDSLTAAMQSLGNYLGEHPGRKNLIWFTARIPRTTYDDGSYIGGSIHDSEGFLFDYNKATEALVLGQVTIYPVDSRGLETNPAFSAARSGIPSNAQITSFGTRQFFEHGDLDNVAEATGGKAFYNTNGIKQVVAHVVDIGANFYTLTFYPSNKNWDNKYRKLKVDVANQVAEQGVHLQYRRGYYAVNDARPLVQGPPPPPPPANRPDYSGRIQLTHSNKPDELAFMKAMQLGAVDPAQIAFTAHVAIDPTVDKLGKAQPLPAGVFLEPKYHDKPYRLYQVIYHVDGNQVQLYEQPNGKHAGHLEFCAVIVDEHGLLVDSATADVNMTLKPETYASVLAQGILMPVKIAVPEKGSYFLRVGVHDVESGKAGALEVSVGDIKLVPTTP